MTRIPMAEPQLQDCQGPYVNEYALSRSSIARAQFAREQTSRGGADFAGVLGMHIWTEFKNAILPWLLAGAVLAFLIAEHRRTTAALLDANKRLSDAVEQQGQALDGVRGLLASQGYTLPPLTGPQ